MLNYSYPLYRPPAEADNLILQITHGCSHNNCSFCSMYKSKRYSVRKLEDIFNDIDILTLHYPEARKIFLADGDALGVRTDYLLEILKYINKSFPKLRRVSTYASAQNILSKTKEELEKLYNHHLNLFYYGIETGDEELLKKIQKGVNAKEIIDSLTLVNQTPIKISATVILGLGGVEYSKDHILNTAKLISQVNINYLSTLQLGLEDDIKEKFYKNFDSFTHLDDIETLHEQYDLLSQLKTKNKIIFRSNHASNALHLSGILPKDKQKLLLQIDEALKYGEKYLIPKIYRGF